MTKRALRTGNRVRGSERQRRIEASTARPKRGGKILSMRQLRKMASTLAKRMYRDASSEELKPQDRKQCAVSFGVLTDKLVLLEPHDRRARVEHDGDPSQLAVIQELALRLAEVGRTPKAENTHSPTKPKR